MSLSNTTENATLKMHLQGTDPSYRAGATQYLALFTADPGESASLVAEATYTGYARVALTKASAWTAPAPRSTPGAPREQQRLGQRLVARLGQCVGRHHAPACRPGHAGRSLRLPRHAARAGRVPRAAAAPIGRAPCAPALGAPPALILPARAVPLSP